MYPAAQRLDWMPSRSLHVAPMRNIRGGVWSSCCRPSAGIVRCLLVIGIALIAAVDWFVLVSAGLVSCSGDSCTNASSICNRLFTATSGASITSPFCTSNWNVNNSANFSGLIACRCSPSGTLNDGRDIIVDIAWDAARHMCYQDEWFEPGDWGSTCSPTTGIIPGRNDCSNTSSPFASMCASQLLTCTSLQGAASAAVLTSLGVNASLQLQCYACDASSVVMYVDESTGSFTKTVTAYSGSCSPTTTCNGHGCCAPVSAASALTQPVGTCSCYQDTHLGFWSAATSCATCSPEYDSSGTARQCTNAKSQIVVLLQSLGTSPATMVLPNLIVLGVFVVINAVRRVWPSDETCDASMMRRAGLPWLTHRAVSKADPQVTVLPVLHRDDESQTREAWAGPIGTGHMAFRKKDIPKRPALSVGIVNRWEAVHAEQLRRGGR